MDEPATIDIVSPTGAPGGVLVPGQVRINGQPVLIDADAPVTVHEMTDSEAVRVTLTLFAGRLTIAAEEDHADG